MHGKTNELRHIDVSVFLSLPDCSRERGHCELRRGPAVSIDQSR